MKEKEVFISKYDSREKFIINNINEYKELLKDCSINEVNRKMMSFNIKIDNIIYCMNEHFYSNNDVIFKDIYKGYKIKKDGSIKRYKVQVQIEDNVLREKIINTFPRDFDFNISRYKS
jgi:hypothetical protein|tara:strand:- start:102 stop:455 length:354 start_codon:yes stop_codon:yes gene_type:complete